MGRNGDGKGVFLFRERRGFGRKFRLFYQDSIPGQSNNAPEIFCVYEQILILYKNRLFADVGGDILIIKFNFLHLWRRSPAAAVYDSVCAEIIVGRTFAEIAAVGLKFFAVTVFFCNRLIYIVPDKSALIEWIRIGQIRVFVHGAAGIPHGVGIFAADKGLIPVLGKERLNGRDRGVHLAFYVAGVVVAAVMEDAFIVYEPGAVQLPEFIRHFFDYHSAVGLVAAGPD